MLTVWSDWSYPENWRVSVSIVRGDIDTDCDQFSPGHSPHTIMLLTITVSYNQSIRSHLWFPFQLCLTSLSTLGVLSEPQIYFPSLLKSPQRKSLLMPQFPYFNFLLPERRSFLPKKVKSAKKTPSHPNINLNRQLDGSPDWQKDLQNQHDSFSSQISQTNISSFFLHLTVWQTPHPWRGSRDNIPH